MPDPTTADGKAAHKLVRQDRAAKLWGQCSCGMWCWLGTYHMPKGRLATLRAEHAKHVEYATRDESEIDQYRRQIERTFAP